MTILDHYLTCFFFNWKNVSLLLTFFDIFDSVHGDMMINFFFNLVAVILWFKVAEVKNNIVFLVKIILKYYFV